MQFVGAEGKEASRFHMRVRREKSRNVVFNWAAVLSLPFLFLSLGLQTKEGLSSLFGGFGRECRRHDLVVFYRESGEIPIPYFLFPGVVRWGKQNEG